MMRPILRRWLLASIAAVAYHGSVDAQNDSWEHGRQLFAANCRYCHGASNHTTSSKAGVRKETIAERIKNQPSMRLEQSLKALSDHDVEDIAEFLNTPAHVSLAPLSISDFGEVAIGFRPRPTLAFKLTSTARNTTEDDRPDSGVTVFAARLSPQTGFLSPSFNCPTLFRGESCDVSVTFAPDTLQEFIASLTVTHNAYGNASSQDVHGTGVSNLEITTLSPILFTASVGSATRTIAIANRLSSNLRFCLDPATPSEFSAPGDYSLAGRSLDANRCAEVSAASLSVTQSVIFLPTGSGPRFAKFTVHRLAGDGTSLESTFASLQGNPGPFAVASPAQLFGDVTQAVDAGATEPATVRLTNSGNDGLRVTAVSITNATGASSPEYSWTGCDVGTVVASLGSCDLAIIFDPQISGPRAAELRVEYQPVADPSTVRTAIIQLSGTGIIKPMLVLKDQTGKEIVSGSTLDFGRQNLNIFYSRTLTIGNVANANDNVTITGFTLAAGSRFSLEAAPSGGCTDLLNGRPQSLEPNESCAVLVRFHPTTTGPLSATLSLANNTGVNPFTLRLTGEGVNEIPVLDWRELNSDREVAVVSFTDEAPTAVGTPTPPRRTIRLYNAGLGAAALQLLNVVGKDAASFTIDRTAANACDFGATPAPVPERDWCNVSVVFSPLSSGSKSASLQLASTGSTPSPIRIIGQAIGASPIAAMKLSPSALDFDATRVGASSSTAALTISNIGTVAAAVTAIEASGPFKLEAGTCRPVPFTLAPNASCSVSLTFQPESEGQANGNVRVGVEGQSSSASATASGEGIEKADLSSGGCSLSDGRTPYDPTLWTLVLFAAVMLLCRHRARHGRARKRRQQPGSH